MKRTVLFLALAAALYLAPDAHATCQKCIADGTPDAMCWVIGQCESYALFSACWEEPRTNPDGSYYEKCVGSPAGSNCNRPPGECEGGGDGGGGGGGGDDDDCQLGPLGCPAWCSDCLGNDN